MNTAKSIIEAFGGLTKMARALGHKHCTTVQGWQKSGNIPDWRRDEIFRAADESGIRGKIEEIIGPEDVAA